MGDAADQTLEKAQKEVEHFNRFQDSPPSVQFDEGIIDETGSIIGNPSSFPGINTERTSLQDIEGLWDI